MKLKYLFLLFLALAVLNSCDDDDDPTYNWKATWTHTYRTIPDGNLLRVDKVYEGEQRLTEEDATLVVKFNPAMIIPVKDSKGNSLIISDDTINTRELKARKVVAYSSTRNQDDEPFACTLELYMEYKLIE